MSRDRYNIIPVTFAVLLHVLIFGSMFLALDWHDPPEPLTPMAITATLVTEDSVIEPLPVPDPVPEAPPDTEPVIEEVVEPVEEPPDESERLEAEQQKREEDARIERERQAEIQREREAEEQRQREAAERQRLQDEEAERQRKAEEERRLEEQRAEAERKRLEDIKRQQEENRRQEEEMIKIARAEEIAREEELNRLMNSNEMLAYQARIRQAVQRAWNRPATAPDDLECLVAITQLPNGDVVSVRIQSCNADDVVVRSIEAAVQKASPLPTPDNPLLFLRNFSFRFTIRE